jgi:hypothetical protein
LGFFISKMCQVLKCYILILQCFLWHFLYLIIFFILFHSCMLHFKTYYTISFLIILFPNSLCFGCHCKKPLSYSIAHHNFTWKKFYCIFLMNSKLHVMCFWSWTFKYPCELNWMFGASNNHCDNLTLNWFPFLRFFFFWVQNNIHSLL